MMDIMIWKLNNVIFVEKNDFIKKLKKNDDFFN